MSNFIHILMVEPGKSPRPVNIENTVDAVEHILGGSFDGYLLMPNQVMVLCRTNGEHLPKNRPDPYRNGYIHGTFLICVLGSGGKFLDSLSPALEAQFQAMFALPAPPTESQCWPREYIMVGARMCATPNELLLAVYNLWDDLAPGESVTLTKGGAGMEA